MRVGPQRMIATTGDHPQSLRDSPPPAGAKRYRRYATAIRALQLGVFCQVVIGQCGVSFPSEKAVGFSPVRNWPVIARVLLFHCIRA